MRYNRALLEKQFMESDCADVLEFYKRGLKSDGKVSKNQKIRLPGSWQRNTKGRAEKKIALLQDIQSKLQEELRQKVQEQLSVDIQELLKQKKALFILINKKIVHLAKHNPQDILAREIDILLNMVKRELGEPTTLTKNHNIEEQPFIPSEDDLDE